MGGGVLNHKFVGKMGGNISNLRDILNGDI